MSKSPGSIVWADGAGVIPRPISRSEPSVSQKDPWDIRKELASGALVTALDTFVTSNASLYVVTAGSVPSQRLRTFIDFLAKNLIAD